MSPWNTSWVGKPTKTNERRHNPNKNPEKKTVTSMYLIRFWVGLGLPSSLAPYNNYPYIYVFQTYTRHGAVGCWVGFFSLM